MAKLELVIDALRDQIATMAVEIAVLRVDLVEARQFGSEQSEALGEAERKLEMAERMFENDLTMPNHPATI